MDNRRIISVTVWSPTDKNFFKSDKNAKAECTFFYCANDNCKLFLEHKQCVNNGLFGSQCPYGNRLRSVGPTSRSRKCISWAQTQRENFKQYLNKIEGTPPTKMAEVGEYLYLPYAFMSMNPKVPFVEHSSFGSVGKPFIKLEDFTVQIIREILNFRAMSLFGGEILDYRDKSIPTFLLHLKELYPAKYEEVIVDYPEFKVKSNINRRALLSTVLPGEVILNKNRWMWNGETLSPIDDCVIIFGLTDVNHRIAIKEMKVIVTPTDGAVVVIMRDDQVSDKTVFVD